MVTESVNTRIHTRYGVSANTQLDLTPVGSSTSVAAHLLDLNKHGGMGLFVASRTVFDKLTLATFLGTWTATRRAPTGPIAFTVRVFNAIPRFYDGRQGYRISALPSGAKTAGDNAKFFFGMRRKSKRVPKGTVSVRLKRGSSELHGRLLNVGDDDGLGVAIEPATLLKATWGDIFLDGWEIAASGKGLPCFIQRLAFQQGSVVVGAVAPGVTRGWDALASGKGPGKGDSAGTTGTQAGDDALLALLNDVLKNKKKK